MVNLGGKLWQKAEKRFEKNWKNVMKFFIKLLRKKFENCDKILDNKVFQAIKFPLRFCVNEKMKFKHFF